ncbi:MAG: (2Fe-2S)-binding protein [Verrucomicrobiota bacterium]
MTASSPALSPQPIVADQASPIVCHCKQVDEASIEAAIHDHEATSIAQITQQTSAGSCCAGCHCRIQRILDGLPPCSSPYGWCSGCKSMACLCSCAQCG